MPDPEEPALIVLKFRFLKSEIPWNVRLRKLLKFALRACQMRLVTIEEVKPEKKEEALGPDHSATRTGRQPQGD